MDEKARHNRNNKKEYTNVSNNKQRIFEYIRRNPGRHLRKIAKDLKLGIGNTLYCLGLLEKEGVVRSRRLKLYKTYYATSALAEKDESLLAVLQQETPRDIISYLIVNPGATQSEIARLKLVTSSTISWHMSRLIEIGLVYGRKDGKFVKYYLRGDINEILLLMQSYRTSIWNKLSERLAHLFLNILEGSQIQDNNIQEKNDTDDSNIVSENIENNGDDYSKHIYDNNGEK